ncbi:hypothetical protein NQZ68_032154 [Dissostichus eleginoides]|nr:hypothetical protein NQZ68_032154 [Dissostichus eleginoides]
MISICMMLFTLATTVRAKGSIECNLSKHPEAQACVGAVGELLIFHLPNTANTSLRLKKDNEYIVLKIQKNKTLYKHEEFVNQYELFTNGTVKLGNATKRHSGDYLLEEFGSNGSLLKKLKVHLEIQAPVSKPAVSQMCLSPELMNISCSSEGDEVEFMLTLNGLVLMQTRGHSQSPSGYRTANMESVADSLAIQSETSVSNVTISMQCQQTGDLLCRVSNNFSRDETVTHLKNCQGCVPSFPVVALAVAGTAITLLLLLVALFLYGIKSHYLPRPATLNDGNPEEEIVYTEVRIMRNTRDSGPNQCAT